MTSDSVTAMTTTRTVRQPAEGSEELVSLLSDWDSGFIQIFFALYSSTCLNALCTRWVVAHLRCAWRSEEERKNFCTQRIQACHKKTRKDGHVIVSATIVNAMTGRYKHSALLKFMMRFKGYFYLYYHPN